MLSWKTISAGVFLLGLVALGLALRLLKPPAGSEGGQKVGNVEAALQKNGKPDDADQADPKADPNLARSLNEKGLVLYQKNDVDAAIAQFRRALKFDPKLASAHLHLGRALRRKKLLEEAIEHFQKAVDLDPKLADAQLQLGMTLQENGNADEAITSYRKALKVDSKNFAILNNLGLMLYGKGDMDGAIELCRKAVEVAPNSALAQCNLGRALYAKKELDEAIAHSRIASQLQPDLMESHTTLSHALLDRGEFVEAQKSAQKAYELVPPGNPMHDDAQMQLQRCQELIALDDKITAFIKGGELPKNLVAQLDVVESWQRAKRHFAAAVRVYERVFPDHAAADDPASVHLFPAACAALAAAAGKGLDQPTVDPKDAARWRGEALAWLRADLVRLEKSTKSRFENAKLVTDHLTPWEGDRRLADVRSGPAFDQLSAQEQKDWRKLWSDADALLQRNQVRAKAVYHNGFATTMLSKGDLDSAISHFEKALDFEPNEIDILNNFGFALEAKGELDQAIVNYRKVLALDPRFQLAHFNLGRALIAKKDLDGAVLHARKAVEIAPEFADAYGILGKALMQKGEFAEARKATLKELELLPADSPKRPSVQNQEKRCDELIALDDKLAPFVKGGELPRDVHERLALVDDWQRFKSYHAVATRLYQKVFADHPALAEDLGKAYRYHAACSAAQAAAGRGVATQKPGPGESEKLRAQALHWLRADLNQFSQLLKPGQPNVSAVAADRLTHWQKDAELDSVREAKALASLPAEEQQGWRKLWSDANEIMRRYQARLKSP